MQTWSFFLALRWLAREVQRCFLRLIFYSDFWRSWEGSWGPLGRSWRPKGSQMGLRREPKAWKKWSPAGFCFSYCFWSDFSMKNMSFSSVLFHVFSMHCLADGRGKRVSPTVNKKFVVGSLRNQGRAFFQSCVNACRNVQNLAKNGTKKQQKSRPDLS